MMMPSVRPASPPASVPEPAAQSGSRQRLGHLLSVAAIPVLVALLYRKTLFGPFVFDDRASVSQNLSLFFGTWRNQVFSNRPLLNLSYAFTFHVSGLKPWAHHLANIALHALNGLLVYAWVRLTLELPRFRDRYPNAPWLALAVALLFSVHPLQTEVAAYVSGRGDALEGSFMLAAMIALTLALRWDALPRWRAAARAGAAVGALCALLSKESGAVGPLLLFLFDWAASGRSPARLLRRHWLLYGVLAASWIVPAWMLWTFPEYAETAGLSFGQAQYGIRPLSYLYTQPGVILHYLRLSVLPVGQVFDYEWPLSSTLLEPGVLLPGLALLGLLVGALTTWRRAPSYAFAVLWFFLTLAPTSSILPIADVIAERRMYLPLVGVLLVIALAFTDGTRALIARGRLSSRQVRTTAAGLTACAAVACSILTWQRNLLWCDPVALWADSVSKSPGNPRAMANLGAQHAIRGQFALGRLELEQAAQLYAAGGPHAFPRIAAHIYTHLASVDLQLGDVGRARDAYRAALAYGAEGYDYLQPRLKRVGRALERLDRR